MSEFLNNPAIGNVLSIVLLLGLILLGAYLSRRMTKIEKTAQRPTVTTSSGPMDQDPQLTEVIARIDQLEAEREIIIKHIRGHDTVLTQILHEFKARAAGAQRVQLHQHSPGTATPFAPQQYAITTPANAASTGASAAGMVSPIRRAELTPSHALSARAYDKIQLEETEDEFTEPAESDSENEEARQLLMGNTSRR